MTEYAAATQEQEQTIAQQPECFLCTLDPHHTCHMQRLEGRLIAARENTHQGAHIPYILLDTGTERVEVQLEEHYYRRFIKELNARREQVALHQLTLRIYHLPTAPVTITYGEKSRLRYQANAYTLAVLEPDILLNITDLNEAEYCTRQYLLKRMIPSGGSFEMLRGNLVHHCFAELLKEHDRGKFNTWSSLTGGDGEESPFQALQRYLEEKLQQDTTSVEVALADVSFAEVRESVIPHLESLARWYESERNTLWTLPGIHSDGETEESQGNQVRAETFLLAPEIGLRGRLDLFWQHEGQQRLLELKTGGASGNLPKNEHRWQVLGYHALLAVRRDARMKRAFATLLYSGTPGKAEAIGIRATIRDIQRVNERRTILVLDRVTGIPSEPPGPAKCNKCRLQDECQRISGYLDWQPPAVEVTPPEQSTIEHIPESGQLSPLSVPPLPAYISPAQQVSRAEDKQFFAHYFHLLQLEGQAGELQQAQLWLLSAPERLAQGSTIQGLEPLGPATIENDGWSQSYHCTNTSELREGDEILLSDGSPITGEVVSGTIMAISSERLTIWTRELISHPTLVDRYENDLVHVRTLQNLMRWQNVSTHLHDLVAGRVRPRFIKEPVVQRADFNREQNQAVERALEMKDYLLIHGPPGTGKTSVIAEIVKQLAARGEKIMLAAFTNQAVDNMLKRLEKEGQHDFLRLGSSRNVDSTIRPYLLHAHIERALKQRAGIEDNQDLAENRATSLIPSQSEFTTPREFGDLVFNALHGPRVVASTTATWSADRYAALGSRSGGEPLDNTSFLFDVAIIDEAGQLTIPAILGALRFARRFILVGDEKQLPPLVLSKQAAEEGLNVSLFSQLKQLDEEHQAHHPLEISACVPLRTQYRMNKWISNFSSTVFYEKQLRAHPSIAERRIIYKKNDDRAIAGASNPEAQAHGEQPEQAAITRALDPRFPLVFVAMHAEEHAENAEQSKQSNAEARAIRELIGSLLARGIAPEDIGVIAPYRAQVANIRRHLNQDDATIGWSALPIGTALSVDTVDRFQGGERQVILISFATTRAPDSTSPRYEFLINPNRLNVALTRAQCKLILVGSQTALQQLPTFNRLITYCQSMNTIIDWHAQPQQLAAPEPQVEVLS
ncbi:AAA family ATPase [Ktedonobacteria bacterium brp13]|nr:AAA family ATPase [Ktedonobacteria bacterium brp13]